MNLKIAFLFILYLGVIHRGNTQNLNLYYNELRLSDGLSELTNMGLHKDSNSFFWMSSRDGLNRFDGENINIFRPEGLLGRNDPTITGGVFEDTNGVLWFSTMGGLHAIANSNYMNTGLKLLDPLKGEDASEYYAFHLDKQSNLWVVADDYLHLKNTISGRDTILHKFFANSCQVIEDSMGRVTGLANPLSNSSGIEIINYANNDFTRKSYFIADDPLGLPRALAFFVYVENDSTIWLPASIGLIRFNPDDPLSYKIFKHKEELSLVRYCDVYPWRDQYLWVASTREGLLLFDKTKNEFVQQDTTVLVNGRMEPLPRVNKLYVDDKENLWLAIWSEKLLYASLSGSKFSFLLSSSSTQTHSVSAITADKTGRLWSAVSEEGIFLLDSLNTEINRSNSKDLFTGPASGSKPYFLYADDEGDIWALSYTTLMLWERKTNKFKLISNDLYGFQRVLQLEKDRYLIMTYDDIYEVEKLDGQILFKERRSIANFERPVFNFYLSSNRQNLLISDTRDILFFSVLEDKFEPIGRQKNVGFISGVSESANNYWLASNKGLLRIRKSDLSHEFIKDQKGLLNRSFNGLLMDDKGEIWLSSNNGLFHYNPNTEAVQHFTQSDGLRNAQFNLASQFKDAEGKLYFGGTNGITYFDPDKVKLNQNPPIIQLTEVLVNSSDTLKGYDLSKVDELTFPYAENTLSFNFVAIEYSAPHENQHAYFLEGYDRDTVYTETRGFAHYPNLPYGRYTLRLMGSNADGVWTPDPRELEIVIRRPWYHTWWFRIASFFLAFILASSLYKRHIDQVREREITKRKEAELKQRVTAHQMALLRLQMNPHFFSNSLSAIGHYVLDEAPRKAYGFLQHFSTLMRGVLEKAAHPYISLEEEIELLTSFLEIKSLELAEGQLSWDIEVDAALDQEVVLVPTMLVQPIVENAIEHGIAPKKGKGSVLLTFKRDKEKLVGTIQDDGIGRAAAAQLENAKKGNAESKAMSITLDRLRLLQQETGLDASMEVIDLVDENGTALGTKVVLILPLRT